MLSGLSQFSRAAVHMPRRLWYAILWATRPPEDVPVGPAILVEAMLPSVPVKPAEPRVF